MNRSPSIVLRLAAPAKAWIQRSALLLLITAAVALMLLGRTHSGGVQTARSAVADAVAPILDFASRPISGTVDAL